ncbi:MAG: hypothetical protein MUF41_03855 [Sphingopyxis sp.]|nr:hypothetical protein [Sphingopyxis sp.]
MATAMAVLFTCPAIAQNSEPTVERRIDRIERELRAVQRRVFPGAEGGVIQPELSPTDPANGAARASASAPVAELSARIDAIEAQLARLTEQVEQSGFRQREIEASITRLRSELGARIDRLEGSDAVDSAASGGTALNTGPATAPAPTPAPRPAAAAPLPAPRPATTTPSATPAPRPAAAATPAPRPRSPAARPATAAASGNAARRAQVEAIEVPSTGNPAEDTYLYGYRLWEARLYPEAQTQLQRVLTEHPNHRRASYAGNLLGRAHLDNGQPSLAVGVLYDNYRNRPRGERAPHSIYYMGQALMQLNRREDACRTYGEIDRVYGDSTPADLRRLVTTAREQARCPATPSP